MTENNEHALLLADTNIIHAAQEYTKQMSMPPEAISSVLRTLQAARVLREMVDSQSKADNETKRRLLVHSKNEPIGDALIKSVDSYCLANMFPYSFIAIIEQQIYPLASGLNLKLLADPRIFRGWQIVNKETITVPSEKPGEPNKNYICRITVRAIFANGDTSEGTGVCDIVELSQKRSKTPPTPTNVELKAETRAKRRTALNIIPLAGIIIEDSSEVDSGDAGANTSAEPF